MEIYWVIKQWNISNWIYLSIGQEKEMYGHSPWNEESPYGATKFNTRVEAMEQLQIGRKKFHWGGVFMIDKIYISR